MQGLPFTRAAVLAAVWTAALAASPAASAQTEGAFAWPDESSCYAPAADQDLLACPKGGAVADASTVEKASLRPVLDETGRKAPLIARDLTAEEEKTDALYRAVACQNRNPEIRAKALALRAEIHDAANRFDEAAVLFREAVLAQPNGPHAISSAVDYIKVIGLVQKENWNIGCYFLRSEVVDLFFDKAKLAGNPDLNNPDLSREIRLIKLFTLEEDAAKLRDDRQYEAAARKYLEIYYDYPDLYQDNEDTVRHFKGITRKEKYREVLFQAFLMLLAADKPEEALAQSRELVSRFGDGRCVYEVLNAMKEQVYLGFRLGRRQEAAASFEAYKPFLEKCYGKEGDHELVSFAISLYFSLGQPGKAFELVRYYKTLYGANLASAAGTVIFYAGLYHVDEAEKTGSDKAWQKVGQYYQDYVSRFAGRSRRPDELMRAWGFIADAYRNQKKPDFKKAEAADQKVIDLYDNGRAITLLPEDGAEGVPRDLPYYPEKRTPARRDTMRRAAAKAYYHLALSVCRTFEGLALPAFLPRGGLTSSIKRWLADTPSPIEAGLPGSPGDGESGRIRDLRRNAWTRQDPQEVQYNHWLSQTFLPWRRDKEALLEKAETAMGRVAELEVAEWRMKAAAKLGDMAASLHQAMVGLPVPPAIAGDKALADRFRSDCEQAAAPYRDKMMKAYERCLIVAIENPGVQGPGRPCREALHRLDPVSYPLPGQPNDSSQDRSGPSR